MCHVVTMFFESIIKIGPHACGWWTEVPACMCLMKGRHTIVYIFLCYFVYIFMPTSIGFYDTLSVHSYPSSYYSFMIFLLTFYANVY
jgi:hypothetical protein